MKYLNKNNSFRFSLLLLFGFGMFSSLEGQRVCAGDQFCLAANAFRGTIQWQSAPDLLTWTDIAGGVTDTLCMTSDSSAYYRAFILEGTCDTVWTDTQFVQIVYVYADAGADMTYCNGSSAMIGGSPSADGDLGPFNYLWSPGANLSDSTVANPMTTVSGPANYVLTVTDSVGCMAMDTVMIDTGGAAVPGVDTFAYTGAVQVFVVPPCIDSITADVYGAQGGANWVNNNNFGGNVKATFAVSPGDTIWVYVGEQPSTLTGGWNGGGNGESGGIGGGGGSDVRMGGQTFNDRIVVAGGGGGAGYWSNLHVVGGQGGGLTGGNGYRDVPATEGGDGGTQTGSGDGTCATFNNPICSGGFGYGGSPSGCGCEGYGGGGGYWGGSGSGNCRGGGGGSGYAIPAASSVSMTNGAQVGHGQVIISW